MFAPIGDVARVQIRSWRVLGVAVVVAALMVGACAKSTLSGHAASGDGASSSPSDAGIPEALPVDWNSPLDGGISVTADEAAASLAFPPVFPRLLGTPAKILINSDVVPVEHRAMGAEYTSDSGVQFWLMEQPTDWTNATLEGLSICPSSGCLGTWKIFPLPDGNEALINAGSGSTAVTWVAGGVRFDIVGPPTTFTINDAVNEASLAVTGGEPSLSVGPSPTP